MLNEAWQLWQALERTKTLVDDQHPLIKPLPASAKWILRVRLAQNGSVSQVETITADERSGLWRIVQTSDGSFPIVAVNEPVLVAANVKKDDMGDLSSALDTCTYNLTYKQDWPWADARQKAAILLRDLKYEDSARDIVHLIHGFNRATRFPSRLMVEIVKSGLDRIRQGRLESLREVGELVIGPIPAKSGRPGKMSVLLVLDVEENGRTVYDASVRSLVMDRLPTNLKKARQIRQTRKTKAERRHPSARSAFGGDGALLEEPFPQVKLPVLGAYFPLVSMHSDEQAAKCNKRYGLTEFTVVPVTREQSRQMQNALTWIVTRDEGSTWRGVASGKFEVDPRTRKKRERKDLLIAFVEEKPDIPAKTASYFGSGGEITEGQFEVDAKAVCDALDGVVQEHPKSKLNLFLIRKASDGQAQIALAESPDVTAVLQAAERWQRAAQNIPNVTLFLQQDKKRNILAVQDAHPFAPYPDQVVRLLSHQWIRDGSSSQAIIGPGFGEVIALMLRTEGKWEPAARRMLDLLIRRTGPMLIGLFGAKHAYIPSQVDDYPRSSRETALRAVAVLGILLDTLGSRKEDYMKGAPYQVGQVLALADTLHKDYCIVVRGGQLPNSLIGTSLMRRAMDNPKDALDDLAERIIEYIRWAKVAQISDKWEEKDQRRIAVNEARKKLRQYQSIAEALGANELTIECSDGLKAQLLLGFLANPPEEQ